MRSLKKNKKASLGIWLGLLFTIFLVTGVYIVVTEPLDTFKSKFYSDLPNESKVEADKLMNIWNMWPILFVVVAIIVAVMAASKRNQDIGV